MSNETELFAAPTNPMPVARQILERVHSKDGYRFRHWRGAWMIWQGSHWRETDDRDIKSNVYKRLEHAEYEVQARNEVVTRPWAPTKRKVADVMEAMSSVALLPSDIDPPAWLDGTKINGPIVACQNGLLHLADRELLEPTPAFFNLVSVPFDYDTDAPEPAGWLKFLGEIWPDDPDQIAVLQEFFGYALSGRTDLHKILLIIGPTRSGKGTIARVLASMLGKGNTAGPTLASLATNFGISPLLGKPLAVVSDARLAGRDTHQVVERLLTISGEDTIDVDRKYREPWTGKLPTRLVILSNELPSFGDASGAIAHRFLVLSMAQSFLGRENPRLTDELSEELPGILNWALEGLDRLTENGRFTEPKSSDHAVLAMKDMASPVSAFVRERCTTAPGDTVIVDDLWEEWKTWCEDSERRSGNKQKFGRDLQSVLPSIRRTRPRGPDGKQVGTYEGVGLQGKTDSALNRDSSDSDDSTEPLESLESRHKPLSAQHSTAHMWWPRENRGEHGRDCPDCRRSAGGPDHTNERTTP